MCRQSGYLKENKARFIAQRNALASLCTLSMFCVLFYIMAEGDAFPEMKLLTAADIVNRLLNV